ncbi:MAG: aminodeoxychorismate lyase, partial [Mycobacterium sp.]|nr:aminodeoxychorismate lyase [Mycobacterium sp.]
MLSVVAVIAVYWGSRFWHDVLGPAADFAGAGEQDIVIEVHDGDSTAAIGQTLADADVVGSARAFVDAARESAAISAIQP